MKATEQYFIVVLFIMLSQGGSNFFESADEILMCDHSNESYRAVLYRGAISCAVQGGSNVGSMDEILSVTIQMKATEQLFPVVLFILLYKVVLTFEPVDEVLKCDHSRESYWALLFCGAVYYAVEGGFDVWVRGYVLVNKYQIKVLIEAVFIHAEVPHKSIVTTSPVLDRLHATSPPPSGVDVAWRGSRTGLCRLCHHPASFLVFLGDNRIWRHPSNQSAPSLLAGSSVRWHSAYRPGDEAGHHLFWT